MTGKIVGMASGESMAGRGHIDETNELLAQRMDYIHTISNRLESIADRIFGQVDPEGKYAGPNDIEPVTIGVYETRSLTLKMEGSLIRLSDVVARFEEL